MLNPEQDTELSIHLHSATSQNIRNVTTNTVTASEHAQSPLPCRLQLKCDGTR